MEKGKETLKEAIAEAKLIKKTAVANAKQQLEELITPKLMSKLSTKIQEMEAEDDEEVIDEAEKVEDEETVSEEKMDGEGEEVCEEVEVEEEEEMDLDELLAELESEVGESEVVDEAVEEVESVDEAEEKEETEEEFDLEEMSETDLEGFIQDVVQEMVDSGEIEGKETEEAEEPVAEAKKTKMAPKPKVKQMKEGRKLQEAYDTINELKQTLQDTNLLNAKLLFTSKIFKSKNLNEGQKAKVIDAFDKATTVKGVKLVYETLIETLKEGKKSINESLKLGSSSKGVIKSMTPKNEEKIIGNEIFERMVKLAGL